MMEVVEKNLKLKKYWNEKFNRFNPIKSIVTRELYKGIHVKQPIPHLKPYRYLSGQALVEFVMVAPILLLILLGAFAVGYGIYQGATASMAIKAPLSNKMQYVTSASSPQSILTQQVTQYRTGNLQPASALDSVTANGDPTQLTSVVVGSRQFVSGVQFLPTINFTVTQGMNTNLMMDNDGSVPKTFPIFMPALPSPPVPLTQNSVAPFTTFCAPPPPTPPAQVMAINALTNGPIDVRGYADNLRGQLQLSLGALPDKDVCNDASAGKITNPNTPIAFHDPSAPGGYPSY
ncbi:MAG: pilus assembly protein [Cyanobacteria bacterium]|nr:pilus assembly protein [Cyanobacteriota bacterium]